LKLKNAVVFLIVFFIKQTDLSSEIYIMDQIKKRVLNIIDNAETLGQKDKYTALNPSSGAYGRFQLIPSVHGQQIEERYNVPFNEIGSYPDIQDDYFDSVLFPRYHKDAVELKQKYPKTDLSEEELTALQQLGKKNVERYLLNEAAPNIVKQVEHFKTRAREPRFSKTKQTMSNKRIP